MRYSAQYLNPSEAAKRLGVSVKTLRLYEERGLLDTLRTSAGWRTYGPAEMERAEAIIALRRLGLGIAQVKRVLTGEPGGLGPALASHQGVLEEQARHIGETIGKLRDLRASIEAGHVPHAGEIAALSGQTEPVVSFNLPWPWGNELFVLSGMRAINYIIGPLGSGKTRLARAIAQAMPDAAFIGLDRLDDDSRNARDRIEGDPALKARIDENLTWLVDEGAVASPALVALLAAFETPDATTLVIDMIEQELDQSSQEALAGWLHRRPLNAPRLFVMTRSSAILDLESMGAHETIIFCPANHSPPMFVSPWPGSTGYEAVGTCLASPEVRARTAGVISWRPQAAS